MRVEHHPARGPGVTQLMAVGDYYKPVGEYSASGLLMVAGVVVGTLFLLKKLGK